jgi:hypothetical protein
MIAATVIETVIGIVDEFKGDRQKILTQFGFEISQIKSGFRC